MDKVGDKLKRNAENVSRLIRILKEKITPVKIFDSCDNILTA